MQYRKFSFVFLLFSIIFLLATGLASAQITLSNSGKLLKPSTDYATTTFSDPWDMSNSEDLWPVFKNISNAAFSNGVFSGKTASSDPQVHLLWGGYPGSIASRRDGINNRIDTKKYPYVAFKMYSSVDGIGQLYWFYTQDTSKNYNKIQFSVKKGWHVYIMRNKAEFSGRWAGKPITLRLDPVNKTGANFSLDWFHLGSSNDGVAPITWIDNNQSGQPYKVYVDSDQSGTDGTFLEESNSSARAANLNIRSLASGTHYLYLNSGADYSNYVPIKISRPPTIKVTDPDLAGGSDWARDNLGNTWDMSNSKDISGTRNITGRGFNNGIYTAYNTGRYGPANDPIVFLNLRGKKINTSRYHRVSIKYKFAGNFDLVRGTMARVGWKNSPNKGWQMSDDLLTYNGWNTITVDLKNASLDVGSYGWNGYVSTFRFDPHEDPYRRRFFLDNVKLAADDELRNRYFDIKYKISDTDSSNVALHLYADRDKTFGNGNEQMIVSGSSSLGSRSYRWRPSSKFNGKYYIYASVDDGQNSTYSYSSGPIQVDTYKPKAYTRRASAKRPGKRKTARYLSLYRIYKAKYARSRSRSLRRRYLSRARKYYQSYRQARKRIANVRLRWYVKDPYAQNEAYVRIKVKKRVRSRLRVKRKARYLRLFRYYLSKSRKTRNRTLKKRYYKASIRYRRAYRKQKTIVYKTVKYVNYRWTKINTWRYYTFKTSSAGVYRYLVYGSDRAGNTQSRLGNSRLFIK